MSSPFNKEKYKRLLEGLEISEILLSKSVDENGDYRFDSSFYEKRYIGCYNVLKSIPTQKLSELSHSIRKGIFDISPENYQKTGVPFLRGADMKSLLPDLSAAEFISPTMSHENSKTELVAGDIVLTKVGTIGDVSVLTDEYSIYNYSQNTAGIHLLDAKNGGYIGSFLKSKYGQAQILRYNKPSVQGKLELDDIRNFLVPVFKEDIHEQIVNIFNQAYSKLKQSKSLYTIADDILLTELGLKKWQPKNENVSIKSFSDFQKAGRLDAEYYQTKYDVLFAQLSKYECDTIKDIAHIKKSVEPGSEAYQDSGIPFVRVSDVTKFGISEPDIYLLPSDFNLNELRPKKDTILLSKDGSVGIAYKVEEDMNCITSGALLHLSVFNKDYTPDYLTLVLNSIVVQMQAERDSNGAIIQHWKPSEIEQVIIPKLSKPIQETISAKIQESFALKAESKRLLDEAKMMVEREIEKEKTS